MDGVIFDSESIWKEATFELNPLYGIDFDEHYRQHLCGRNESDIREELKVDFPNSDVDVYRDHLISLVRSRLGKTPMKANFLDLISICKLKGIKIGLATSSDPERAYALFSSKGIDLDKIFDSVLFGTQVSKSKPDPEIFLKTVHNMGLNPEECIVVEDSINGLKAAVQGRFVPIMMIDSIEPDSWVDSMDIDIVRGHDDLIKVIEGIESAFELYDVRKKTLSYTNFVNYSDPIFSIASKLDVSKLYMWCKDVHNSFFIEFMHVVVTVINEMEWMRARLLNGEPVLYKMVCPSFIVMRDDGTICTSLVQYSNNCEDFFRRTRQTIDYIKHQSVEPEFNNGIRLDVVYISSMEWIEVVGFKNPYNYNDIDSCSIPRISWGKVVPEADRFVLVVDVSVHHALMDGAHLASFFIKLQQRLDNFSRD